jgi:hypothetical protein
MPMADAYGLSSDFCFLPLMPISYNFDFFWLAGAVILQCFEFPGAWTRLPDKGRFKKGSGLDSWDFGF